MEARHAVSSGDVLLSPSGNALRQRLKGDGGL